MTRHSDDDDEVLHEWDVFVGTELSPFLHLCPLQSASLASRLNSQEGCCPGRFKPASKRLELNLPFSSPERDLLEAERAQQLQMNAGMKISGAAWPWRPVQYLVGRFSGDELFLNPVESVIPLSPSLSNLDEFEARQRAASSLPLRQRSDESIHSSATAAGAVGTTSTTPTTPQTKTIQMQFRKKETEEQVQARLNSFAYLQRQVDDEPWLQLKHFSGQAQELEVVRERMIGACRDPIEFVKDEKDYIDLVVGVNALKAYSNELEEMSIE